MTRKDFISRSTKPSKLRWFFSDKRHYVTRSQSKPQGNTVLWIRCPYISSVFYVYLTSTGDPTGQRTLACCRYQERAVGHPDLAASEPGSRPFWKPEFPNSETISLREDLLQSEIVMLRVPQALTTPGSAAREVPLGVPRDRYHDLRPGWNFSSAVVHSGDSELRLWGIEHNAFWQKPWSATLTASGVSLAH
ncbi:hypothetical protein CCUS01_03043 [Colletotrichum cuscutae]|uniref:Uncharacterized protein n=1 Tax=Colletotrichum cuscutae TaxID=1209917 RepID=A0AAJ0DMU0_9PEZI|nr:hypothetical protein CCUS01_03043 [Colletotrichum cuscutae]